MRYLPIAQYNMVRAESDIIDALIPDPDALKFKQPVFWGD